MQMWPILCSFNALAPFTVAVYCGKAKPSSVQDYLSDFHQELQQLKQDGIVHGEKTLQVTVKAFICDAPARSFLKFLKTHNSYFACERCTVRGTYMGRVVLVRARGTLGLCQTAIHVLCEEVCGYMWKHLHCVQCALTNSLTR